METVTLPVTLYELVEVSVCAVCGNSLAGRRSHATTCSAACRKAKSRGRLDRRLRDERVARWELAAEGVDYRLGEWIVKTLDVAADDLLGGERRLAQRLSSEADSQP